MTLGDLIRLLEALPPALVIDRGFTHPHSYRGYYERVAFEPCGPRTIAELLGTAKSALGTTYQGWKGGHFRMTISTLVHLAVEGDCGPSIEGFGFILGEA